jgi:hypothetical protein
MILLQVFMVLQFYSPQKYFAGSVFRRKKRLSAKTASCTCRRPTGKAVLQENQAPAVKTGTWFIQNQHVGGRAAEEPFPRRP